MAAAVVAKTASNLLLPSQSKPSPPRAIAIKPLTKKRRHLKFAGPVVLVIDTRKAYCLNVWFTIGLGLVNVFIGAVNMTAIAYSVKSDDAHAAICTIAFHFFSAEAILSLNYANGWSAPMRIRHRKFAHVFLQICGLVCTIAGIVLVILAKGLKASPHGITGIVTTVLAGLSLLSGFGALCVNKSYGLYFKIVHMSIGMPTFLMSSICLCLGFFTNDFKTWATSTIVFILMGFVVFYTTFIVLTVFIKCVSRF